MTILANNYFDLFGLTPSFVIDKQKLDLAYRQLQQLSHPDRFVNHSTDIQRQSVQLTAQNVEAYHTLKSAVQRACYLLTILGSDFDLHTYRVTDINLLMQQMQYRDQLSDLKELGDYEKLQQFSTQIDKLTAATEERIGALFELAREQDYTALKNQICELQFLTKLAVDLDEVEEYLLIQQ